MAEKTKFIFVTGGVVSGLGKGITGSSLGNLLKNSGLTVSMQKMDPYLNVDPGTISPYEHGEVYVTYDGGETDLDLGHYERFIDEKLSKASSISSGKIYSNVLNKEREGKWVGSTIQVIPHITDEIKNKLYEAAAANHSDVLITEIGGTVGDIESEPYMEAIRQMIQEKGKENVCVLHVALLPYLKVSHEYKTKPIQHSVKELLRVGITPDIIVTRSDDKVDKSILEKIALFCNVPVDHVIQNTNADSIYKVPLELADQNMQKIVIDQLHLQDKAKPLDLTKWKAFVKTIDDSKSNPVHLSIVGKYVDYQDSYLTVIEGLKIAGWANGVDVKIDWVQSEDITPKNVEEKLKDSKGILVPGGFGTRGVEGMILAASYAREHDIPYLGICLGMQVATIAAVRDLLNKPDGTSTEFDPKTTEPVFDYVRGIDKEHLGGTMRLGEQPATLKPGSLAAKLYGTDVANERHRHRYEFNADKYQKELEAKGVVFSGIYKPKNLVEIMEIPGKKFYIGSQYHPEFTSRPGKPNPLFNGFVQAVIKENK